ncbi:MAG TPA: inositol monophosphatase [Anaerolineae bacterium]|nr:inositol monophosphatase [Anaerolineae bacterium]
MAVIEERLALAKDLALEAGALLREGAGHVTEIRHKGEIDLITEFDLRSEQLLIEGIHQAFPQDAILAEEDGSIGEGDYRWLIDPLDGTTNFTHGIPVFSVSIAYTQGNQPLLGVVYDPMREELFSAAISAGAWLNDRRIRVSSTTSLNKSLLVTGFSYDIRTNPDNNLDHFAAFALRTRGVRRMGSAAMDLAYVAASRFDGYWEMRLWPWDWGAGILLVSEAGGHVTRTNGEPNVFAEPTSILATNGHLHDEMLAVLNRNAGG